MHPSSTPRQKGTWSADLATSVVEGYLAGRSIPHLATIHSTTAARVRRILHATDGLVLRDDRTTNSGGKPRAYPAEQVAAVRRLYLDEGLTQAQVADELRTTPKVISNLMARHDIPARPDIVTAGPTRNAPGHSTLTAYRADLDAAGVTPADLRTWAREHDIDVPVTGIPPRHVFNTYLAAQAPDEPQPAPTPLPTTSALADLFAELTKTLGDLVVALDRLTPTPNQEQ